jgi:diguanylate cyclase (GGDEF)-like protein
VEAWSSAQTSRKVREDLLERSMQGVWAHPICMVLVLATTGIVSRSPKLAAAFALCTLALAGARFGLIRAMVRCPDRWQRWHQMHTALLMACAGVWGTMQGVLIFQYGYRDQDVLTTLLYLSAIAFGTVYVLVHDSCLMAISLAMFFVAPTLGDLLHRGSSPFPFLGACLVCLLYCSLQWKKLNHLYEQQISDNRKLFLAARQDTLTGLANRLYMNEILGQCFDDVNQRPKQVALLYIDLDGFKQINDQYSHKVGDLFLREVARRICHSVRDGDVVARIGGDEFTVLLAGWTLEEEVLAVASRVLTGSLEPMRIEGHMVTYSASIGVSFFPHTADDQDGLIRSADEAMYKAKRSGKGRICVARPIALGPLLTYGHASQAMGLSQ